MSVLLVREFREHWPESDEFLNSVVENLNIYFEFLYSRK